MGTESNKIAKITDYKDLLVWQRSMGLAEAVYKMTGKLPPSEQWGLISQMRRAAVSVPSNIAEGYGRQSSGEYRHFLAIGRGSLLELETLILLCQRLDYLGLKDMGSIIEEIQQISKMLWALICKVKEATIGNNRE